MSFFGELQPFSPKVKAISFDIFDTILLRDTTPELVRFYEVSRLHAAYLTQNGYSVSQDQVYAARRIAHSLSYRVAPLNEYQREPSIQLMFRILLAALEIDFSIQLMEPLVSIELEYEKKRLSPNRALLSEVKALSDAGFSFYLISDMYFRHQDIEVLLQHHCPEFLYGRLYVSSEYGITKHGLTLYRYFLEEEGLAAENVIHVGDNYHSDKANAEKVGMSALHLARSPLFYFLQSLRLRFFSFFKK